MLKREEREKENNSVSREKEYSSILGWILIYRCCKFAMQLTRFKDVFVVS